PGPSAERAACSWIEPVADAPHRNQMPGFRWVPLDLLPQPADVDGDRFGAAFVREVPQFLEKIPPAEHPFGMARQEVQDLVLPRSELDEVSAKSHLAAPRVDREIAGSDAPLGSIDR